MINELINRYPNLQACEWDIRAAFDIMTKTFENGGKLLICGNGGSSADCDHIVGELMKGFLKKREIPEEEKARMRANFPEIGESTLTSLQRGLPAISLTSMAALNSAFCNDVDPELVFAQSLFALAKENDCLLAISTSGNAKNVARAVEVARSLGIKTIGLSGQSGGKLANLCDVCIRVPECETFKIQELHLPVYHALCAELEKRFFS